MCGDVGAFCRDSTSLSLWGVSLPYSCILPVGAMGGRRSQREMSSSQTINFPSRLPSLLAEKR